MTTTTDIDWQTWGSQDPYHGALSHDRFKRSNWNDDSLREFFQSGEDHIDRIFDAIVSRVDSDFDPNLAIDFGCGPGRLVLPLARRCQMAIGVDVSQSMLDETCKNANRNGIKNCETVLSDDTLSYIRSDADFVHSFIVFQHIPTERGLFLMSRLLDKLRPGGIAALHATVHRNATRLARLANHVRYNSRFAAGLANVIQRKPFSTPLMRRFMYPPMDVLKVYQQAGLGSIAIDLEEQGNCTTAIFYGKKAV